MRKKLEKKLNQQAIQAFINHTEDFVFLKNKDFVYVDASESFASEVAGIDCVKELIGRTDFEIFKDREIAQKYRTDDERMFADKLPVVEFREEYPQKDGKRRYCQTKKYLILDENGEPYGILGQCQDITQQVELEQANQSDINRKVAIALNSVYFASTFVNLKENTFTILKGMDYSNKVLEKCQTPGDAFAAFIHGLVRQEYVANMQEFCDVDTIAIRLQNEKKIDCEYRSKIEDSWRRASFIPVEYDDSGEVICALFVVSRIDAIYAHEIEERISNKKSLRAIFDRVPAGIVLYKWDGNELTTLNISRYYENLYGYSMAKNGKPDFARIHPDDLNDFREACRYALQETHTLEYVYRVWNDEKKRYVWIQVNAVAEKLTDETSLVYVIYTDITKQKNAEILLEKREESLVSALSMSKQLCYEYDPKTHRQECLVEDTIFHLPRVIENYPEAVLGIVHPDDRDLFIQTIHSMDEGTKEVSCNIRLKEEKEYVWYAYQLRATYDVEKERMIVLLSIMDNSEHILSLQAYKDRMNALLNMAGDSLTLGLIDVTENSFRVIYGRENVLNMEKQSSNLDEMIHHLSKILVDEKQREKYVEFFSPKKLITSAKKRQLSVQMDHLCLIGNEHLEWVRTCIELVKNPETGHLTGVCYAKSIQEEVIRNLILGKIVSTDYLSIALIYEQTGDFYLFDSYQDYFFELRRNYWDNLQRVLPTVFEQDMGETLNKEKIMQNLRTQGEYAYTFYSNYTGELRRIECHYTYADKDHDMIMMTLRNITDEALLRQYKHDSEHDPVTGLWNRRTVFEKAKVLLEEYPDEQFAMLHGDVKNFKLYNSFFGEEEGDKLLCTIAECIEGMNSDYDHWAYGRIEADVFCIVFPYKEELFMKQMDYLINVIPKIHNDFLVEPNLGLYLITDPAMPVEAMFTRASIAAKTGEKNWFGRIALFTERMEKQLVDNQQIAREMKKAVTEEQFQVYLQPKYSLRTEEIVGSEALVRWIHPVHGMVSPGRFIPVFEKNGFIVELDHYMWEHVCQMIRRWLDEKKTVFPVSVNVSRVSMYSQGTVEYLKSLVQKYKIEPRYLELELTETAYMDDPEEMKGQLKELQEFGFHILMDDFGSGYSSLNTLRELPVDVLKLDMKFLSEPSKDLRGNVVLSTVVRMSKLLRLPIVAVGVETKVQATYLRSLGCEYVQGYYFARPMPVADYEKLLPQSAEISETKEDDIEGVYEHIMVSPGNSNEVSPIPTGFVEYVHGTFAFIRLNKAFLDEFELNHNLNPASIIFKEYFDPANYEKLLHAFSRCKKTKDEVTFNIVWKVNESVHRNYLAKVKYVGKVGNQTNLVIAFMNTTVIDEL